MDMEKILADGQEALKQHPELVHLIQSKQNEKRFTHSLGVAAMALHLAKTYGADPEKALVAGLCHDITKQIPLEEQEKILRDAQYPGDKEFWEQPQLWHAVSGSYVLRGLIGEYPELDEEICTACCLHTVGKPAMSKLEAVVYLADMMEPSRVWNGVEKLRAAADISLEGGVALSYKMTLEHLGKNGVPVHSDAFVAFDYYRPYLKEVQHD